MGYAQCYYEFIIAQKKLIDNLKNLLEKHNISTLKFKPQTDDLPGKIYAAYRTLRVHLHPDGNIEPNGVAFVELGSLYDIYTEARKAFNEMCRLTESHKPVDDVSSAPSQPSYSKDIGPDFFESSGGDSSYELNFLKKEGMNVNSVLQGEVFEYLRQSQVNIRLYFDCYLPSFIMYGTMDKNLRLEKALQASLILIFILGFAFAALYFPPLVIAIIKGASLSPLLIPTMTDVILFLTIGVLAHPIVTEAMVYVFIYFPLVFVFDPIIALSRILYNCCKGEKFFADKNRVLLKNCAQRELAYVKLLPIALLNSILFNGMPLALVLQLSYAACAKVGSGASYLGSKLGLFSSSRNYQPVLSITASPQLE